MYWGTVFFTTRRGVLEKSFFKIIFIGVNFEAGNETRVKIWSDFVAEQNEEWSEKRVVFLFISLFSREREIEVSKKICKREKFFVHVRHFKAVFFRFFVKRVG